jgi:hypothetical protein
MKKFLILTLAVVTFASCKNEESQSIEPTEIPLKETAKENTHPSTTECYEYNADGSKVQLKMTNKDNEVSGVLTYELKEKDSNKGTIKGEIKDNKLIAVYTFQSEGIESTREVAFLLKDNQLIEGYGEVVTEGNSVKFKDTSSLDYSSNMPLSKVDCQK